MSHILCSSEIGKCLIGKGLRNNLIGKCLDWQMPDWQKKVIGTFQIGKDLIGQWLSAAVESANGIQSS